MPPSRVHKLHILDILWLQCHVMTNLLIELNSFTNTHLIYKNRAPAILQKRTIKHIIIIMICDVVASNPTQ